MTQEESFLKKTIKKWGYYKCQKEGTSLEIEVMKTAGRTLAIEVSANLEVRHESPAAVKGRPYFEDGTHQSASQHISSRPGKKPTWP